MQAYRLGSWMRSVLVLVVAACGATSNPPRNSVPARCIDAAYTLRGNVDGVSASAFKQSSIKRTCEKDRWSHEAIECIVREQQLYVCRSLLSDPQREHYSAALCAYQAKYPDENRDIEDCNKPRSVGTLYDRLGGRDGVFALVREWLAVVASDGRINAFFANSDLPHLQQALADQICQLASGPCSYKGKPMSDAHAGMGIMTKDYDAFLEDLTTAMSKRDIKDRERAELLEIMRMMRDDIIDY
jgi:hemoglobin